MKDEKVPLKTILQNFINHVENLETRLKENDDLYESEFQELKNISDSLKNQKYYACTEGEKPVNRRKNRYKDILPFDVSRVVLSEFPGVAGSDYINANYIRGASGSPAYIASQGPLPHTVADFWRMAVECEVQVIVMACNQTEAGKHKCEHYVPEEEEQEQTFGDVGVTLSQSRQVCPDFTVKKLLVRYTGSSGNREERLVCQFHYSAWPDHGVPSSVVPLLHMIRMLRDTQASETLPVLVHCSAGCGRTGTVCAIDYVWGLLKAGKLTPAFNLFDLVAEMRRQRIAMVQTKDQYMLVHRAVRQLFADQLRVIESHPYANVDIAGKALGGGQERPNDDGDYEEICVVDEVSPSVQKRPAPSPPPQIKPPPRKNAPRNRSRPPPLPHKRKAPQPGEESPAAAAAGGDGLGGSLDRHRPQSDPPPAADPQYQGSLDRAETGRRASVGRLREVFEGSEAAPPAARLARSKSSAAIRPRPPGPPAGRPRTGSISDTRDAQLVLYVPRSQAAAGSAAAPGGRGRPPEPPNYAEVTDMRPTAARLKSPPPPGRTANRPKSPPQVRLVNRAKSPPQVRPVNRAKSPQVRLVNRAKSPPQVRPVNRAKSPPQVRPVNRAKSPQVRPVNRAKSPPQVRPVPRAKSPQVRPVTRARSPPQVRPISRTKSSPISGVMVNNVAALQPVVRIVSRACSPPGPGRGAGRPVPVPDRRPVLPIKRSKSLKMTAAPLRVQRLGPAYLALENTPSWDGERARRDGLGRGPPPPVASRPPLTLAERQGAPPVTAGPARLTTAAATGAGAAGSGHQPPTPASRSAAAVQPLYVNVSVPLSGLGASPGGSPPRYVNIDLLQQYEEELVQRSRELGLNDTLPDEQPSPRRPLLARRDEPAAAPSWAGPPLLSPALVTSAASGAATDGEPHYANVPSPPPPPPAAAARRGPPPPVQRRPERQSLPAAEEPAPPPTNYPNCTPEARQNIRRIETELQRNQRSGFYDASGESAAESRVRPGPAAADTAASKPAPTALGWHARERRNSFRQAVEGGEPARVGNYEPIWVGEERGSPAAASAAAAAAAAQQQCASLPPEVERRAAGPLLAPRPFATPRTATSGASSVSAPTAAAPAAVAAAPRPAVVPVSSYIVQGDGGESPDSPRLVGNSLFWADGQGRRDTAPAPAAAAAASKVTANSVFYSRTPSPPGRSTSLNVSENSAFKPYLPDKAASPNYAAVYKQQNGCSPPLSGPESACRSDGARSADSAQRGPVAPPRKRASSGVLLSRLSVSQPQLVGPSHLFLADIEMDGGDGEERDSDTDSLPPAVPEKTQAAYQVPTPVREVLEPPPPPPSAPVVRQRTSGSPPLETPGGSALCRSLSLRPGARLEATEPRPFNRALGRLQATASSLRSRLSGRTEPPPPPPSDPEPPPERRRAAGVNAHSRQAYI